MIDYAKELNASQLAAVEYNDGPSLVIAGAGSGKTRVLTYKIARLMDDGYRPWEILALTFTNKAAAEMKERIARRVGDESARYLWMGTFHSMFARILRREGERLGFTPNFSIYDQSDSRSLVRAIIKEMDLDEKVYKPATVQGRISEAKNVLIDASAYGSDASMYEEDMRHRMPMIRNIYERYATRLRKADAMDFDDLLINTYKLFQQHPDVLQTYRDRFRFVLVDEYQDTNLAQHEIVWQLTAEHRHVCVVGDDSQSIYSFRGARIDNILTFRNRYDNPRLFKLEENYRSTKTIVQAANSLIEHNSKRIPKEVFSNREQGEPITLFEAAADKEEAGWVIRRLTELRRRNGLLWDDFAILYRTNAQSRVFEEELRRNDIPYRIYGGLSFYQRKEIKDIIAYFRLVVNPRDEEALKRIINYPTRGLGDTTLGHIIQAATDSDVSLWEVLCNPEGFSLDAPKRQLNTLSRFQAMIDEFRELATHEDAYTVGRLIIERSGIKSDIFSDMSDEGRSRQENTTELLDGMQDFVQTAREEGSDAIWLSDFLAGVALLTDQDDPHAADEPRVTLMTVHSAKGLEFDTVFVVGMEEDLFPSNMSDTPAHMEEERRLFYVAVTRAEKRCLLSWARSRFRYGQMQFGHCSRFITELDPSCLSGSIPDGRGRRSYGNTESRSYGKTGGRSYGGRSSGNASPYEGRLRPTTPPSSSTSKPTPISKPAPEPKPASTLKPTSRPAASTQPSSSAPQPTPAAPSPQPRRLVRIDAPASTPDAPRAATAVASLAPGMRIEHERFGRGVVVRVEGANENAKAVIRFDNLGEKTLLLKYARFKVLG